MCTKVSSQIGLPTSFSKTQSILSCSNFHSLQLGSQIRSQIIFPTISRTISQQQTLFKRIETENKPSPDFRRLTWPLFLWSPKTSGGIFPGTVEPPRARASLRYEAKSDRLQARRRVDLALPWALG